MMIKKGSGGKRIIILINRIIIKRITLAGLNRARSGWRTDCIV